MNKEIIKSIVLSQKEAIKFDEKIFILRDKINILDDYLNNNFIIIISGIRRSGKSMLLQFIKEKKLRSDYYINFDDNRLVNFLLDDFEKLYESFLELFGEQNVFYFDEIQLIEGWEKFVRRLHNEGKKVFITGSNSTMLSRELGTHLTGRNIQIELYPFSFQEFLKYKNFTFSKNDIYLPQNKAKIKNYLDEYINLGGFPEFLLISNKEFFKNLYDNILFKDVITRYNLRDERILKELLYFVNSNISNEVSFNKLKNIFGLSNANTIKEYI
ncbi:ATP-binding protein, partial [Candidatus Gracilibacteria bacterium]|nr:ATP-binding protein [Candidatus Gracilibacteria bacterium]